MVQGVLVSANGASVLAETHCTYCGEFVQLSDRTREHEPPKMLRRRQARVVAPRILMSCRSCNAKKGCFTDEEFRGWLRDDQVGQRWMAVRRADPARVDRKQLGHTRRDRMVREMPAELRRICSWCGIPADECLCARQGGGDKERWGG